MAIAALAVVVIGALDVVFFQPERGREILPAVHTAMVIVGVSVMLLEPLG